MSVIAEIIINTTAKRLQQTFSYTVPDHLAVRVGSRVIVPFGFRREEGIVVALHEALDEPADFTLKPIEGLLSSQTGFREEMIETALWIRDYYVCNLSDALRLFMIDKRGLVRREVLSLGPTPATTAEGRSVQLYVADKGRVEKGALGRKFGRDLVSRLLAENGLCSEIFLKNKIADKMEDWLAFEKDDLHGTLHGRPKQQALLAELKEKRTAPAAYFQSQGYTRDLMRRLCATGLARWEQHPAGTTNILPTLEPDEALPLTAEQKDALHVIEGDEGGKTYVLHGITAAARRKSTCSLPRKCWLRDSRSSS